MNPENPPAKSAAAGIPSNASTALSIAIGFARKTISLFRNLFCPASSRSDVLSSALEDNSPLNELPQGLPLCSNRSTVLSSALDSSPLSELPLELLLCSDRSAVLSSALDNSPFSKFPPGVLLCIVDQLTPVSIVTFSLSCKPIRDTLATHTTHAISLLATSKLDTVALLELLALDLPNQIACTPCKRLHDMKNLRKYNAVTYGASPKKDYKPFPACISSDDWMRSWSTRIGLTRRFGETAFKMAVKRWHHDSACTALVEQMSSKRAEFVEVGNFFGLVKEDCKVLRGNLMHRLYRVYIWKTGITLDSLGPKSSGLSEMLYVCRHVRTRNVDLSQDFDLQKCQVCRTEWRFERKHYEEQGLEALFFARWKDLGSSPQSEEWQNPYVKIIDIFRPQRVKRLHIGRELAEEFGTDGQNSDCESLFPQDDMNRLFEVII